MRKQFERVGDQTASDSSVPFKYIRRGRRKRSLTFPKDRIQSQTRVGWVKFDVFRWCSVRVVGRIVEPLCVKWVSGHGCRREYRFDPRSNGHLHQSRKFSATGSCQIYMYKYSRYQYAPVKYKWKKGSNYLIHTVGPNAATSQTSSAPYTHIYVPLSSDAYRVYTSATPRRETIESSLTR